MIRGEAMETGGSGSCNLEPSDCSTWFDFLQVCLILLRHTQEKEMKETKKKKKKVLHQGSSSRLSNFVPSNCGKETK